MNEIREKAHNFLRDMEMHPDLTEVSQLKDSFIEEMELGLKGRDSSLMMIPTYLGAAGTPANDEPVIVMDAGGTNFRRALVTFKNGVPEITNLEIKPMPGSQGEISRDEYLEQVASYIRPLTDQSRRISFCFSYPTHILPNKDGVLTTFSKEVKVRDSDGMTVGEALLQHMNREDLSFVILNDTVACMLGGVADSGGKEFDGMAGLILGTGLNICYLEKGNKITKVSNAGDMIINTECGIFDKLHQGEADKILDGKTENPRDHVLEKMVSGAYTGGLITETIRLADGKGIFSGGFMADIKNGDYLEMPVIDGFLKKPFGDGSLSRLCRNDDDAEALYAIIDCITERAAKLICGALAAHVEQVDGGKSPLRPFCVAAEGSMFFKSPIFRGKLDYWVREYINKELGRYLTFIKAENANLTGGALASLLN